MKSFIAVMTALFILSFSTGGQETKSQQHQMDSTKVEKHIMHKQHKDIAKVDQYTCPMHPEVITHKPGKCPKCGMTLVKKEVKKVKEETKKISSKNIHYDNSENGSPKIHHLKYPIQPEENSHHNPYQQPCSSIFFACLLSYPCRPSLTPQIRSCHLSMQKYPSTR